MMIEEQEDHGLTLLFLCSEWQHSLRGSSRARSATRAADSLVALWVHRVWDLWITTSTTATTTCSAQWPTTRPSPLRCRPWPAQWARRPDRTISRFRPRLNTSACRPRQARCPTTRNTGTHPRHRDTTLESHKWCWAEMVCLEARSIITRRTMLISRRIIARPDVLMIISCES